MKKGFLKRIGGYFGCLKGNDRVCIAFHPLWGVPYTFYTYYISLYLKEIGLTDTALGRLMVAGTVASFLFRHCRPSYTCSPKTSSSRCSP